MKILLYDRMQDSDAADSLISAPLADTITDTNFTITFDESETINCIGIGNTDATTITVNGEDISITDSGKYANGLYALSTEITGTTLTVSHNGTYLGRMAAGQYTELGLSPPREPGFVSTANPRMTLAGQVIKGAGGITKRVQQVDIRYKVDSDAFTAFQNGFDAELREGFPVFVLFDIEYDSGNGRFPWPRLYATIGGKQVFQSSVNRLLHSIKIKFEEAF